MDSSFNNTSKVPFDPGWNDPPSFSYNAQQTTPNRPRNFLNKRVAFPIAGSTPIGTLPPCPPANLPPLPSMQPLLVQSVPIVQLQSAENLNSESTLLEVKGLLLKFLEESTELGSKANDIKKRISAMEEMWSSGKLNASIHAKMKDLACALGDDQPSIADDIHRALMVDHVGAVGSWMPGIKQLIHHCIARSELLALDKE